MALTKTRRGTTRGKRKTVGKPLVLAITGVTASARNKFRAACKIHDVKAGYLFSKIMATWSGKI